jgi:hypothetical protein
MSDKSASFIGAFTYERGPLLEIWRDLSGNPRGDCESFAWTVLKLEAGGTVPAIKALVKRDAAIWRCWSKANGAIPRHAVLRIGDRWIDSTERKWRDTPAPHRKAWPVGTVPLVAALAFVAGQAWLRGWW